MKPENIIWSNEASVKVVGVAAELHDRYGAITDIPLVGSDIRDNVARLAQAGAALVHSTEDHERVTVLPEHVEYVGLLFQAIYDHDNCHLYEYAANCRQELELDEAEYRAIKADVVEFRDKAKDLGRVDDMLVAFRRSSTMSLNDLICALNIGRDAVQDRVAILKKHRLVRSGRYGYSRTPRFVSFLRRLEKEEGAPSPV